MFSHRPVFRRLVISALLALACAIWAGAAYGTAAPDVEHLPLAATGR